MSTESGIEITPAQSTRNAELMMRSPISFVTGSCAAIDMPASPCSRPPAQRRYCSTSGRLRWSCSRSAARLAAVAVRPRMARAVSPGRACVATKMTIETRNSTSPPRSRRRPMNPQIGFRTRATPGEAVAAGPPGISVVMPPLAEPDGPVAMAKRGEVECSLARLEPRHLGAVSVDQVVEERNDVAALVVLQFLHLVLERDALGLVDLGQRLLVERQVVRAGGWPVAFVIRRGRDAAVGHLRQVVASAPEVDRESELQVSVAVIVGVVLDGDRHPCALGLLGEDVGHVDHACGTVGGVQVDRHA